MQTLNSTFLIEQITNTLDVINDIDLRRKKDKTILLNSLLSLVVLPLEVIKKTNKSRVFSGKFKDIAKQLGVNPLVFQPINNCNSEATKYGRKSIYEFFRKLRNGVAHQNIEVTHSGNSIIFYNIYVSDKCKNCSQKVCLLKGLEQHGSGVIDFKIELDYKHIRTVGRYLAKSFINTYEVKE